MRPDICLRLDIPVSIYIMDKGDRVIRQHNSTEKGMDCLGYTCFREHRPVLPSPSLNNVVLGGAGLLDERTLCVYLDEIQSAEVRLHAFLTMHAHKQ